MIVETEMNEYAELEARINHLKVRRVDDFVKAVDFPINKCLYTGDPVQIKKCEDELLERYGQKLSIFKSEDYFLEVMPQNIDKAASLDRLIHVLGIEQKDVVCCGD